MYSLKQVLSQTPEKIKVVVLSVGAVVCAAKGLKPDLWETLGIGLAVERTLDLFYVAPINAAKNTAQALTAFENVKLNAQRLPLRTRPIHPQAKVEDERAGE